MSSNCETFPDECLPPVYRAREVMLIIAPGIPVNSSRLICPA
ncbi:hypothetical protein ASZ90_016631 [hydrocarbon metagenome]|uniref:Uncharacterized protein n=1 Tax=hydrocarbon metagenome TaxID=938273 RepID=A0A0W8EKF2_9ZZZZ